MKLMMLYHHINPHPNTDPHRRLYHRPDDQSTNVSFCGKRILDLSTGSIKMAVHRDRICRRCFPYPGSEEAKVSRPQMVIVFRDGQEQTVDLTEAGSWRIDTIRQVLIVGRRLPRMEFPLCNIRYYLLENKP